MEYFILSVTTHIRTTIFWVGVHELVRTVQNERILMLGRKTTKILLYIQNLLLLMVVIDDRKRYDVIGIFEHFIMILFSISGYIWKNVTISK